MEKAAIRRTGLTIQALNSLNKDKNVGAQMIAVVQNLYGEKFADNLKKIMILNHNVDVIQYLTVLTIKDMTVWTVDVMKK